MGNYRRSLIHRQAQAWLILLVATIACSAATELRCPDCPTLEVSRVIDGDTFDSPAGRVRLFGVDTPERGQRCTAGHSANSRQWMVGLRLLKLPNTCKLGVTLRDQQPSILSKPLT